MIAKAAGLDADMVFLDLEDSVAPAAKGDARARVANAILGLDWRAPTLAVRVNPVVSPYCLRDLTEVVGTAGRRIDVVILPKLDDPGHLAFADHLLAALESELGLEAGSIGVDAQIESARGLAAVEAIAACCPRRLEALVLGPGDLAADLGTATATIGGPVAGYPGDGWHAILSRLLVAARATGLQAIDGPYAAIDDPEGLAASAARSRALGYDGKWSIHPSQIAALNAAYGVAREDFDRACAVVEAYERAVAQGRGAVRVDGEMVDEATRRMAGRIVARGRLAGMEPPAGA